MFGVLQLLYYCRTSSLALVDAKTALLDKSFDDDPSRRRSEG